MLTLRQIELISAVMPTGALAGTARLHNVSAQGASRLMKFTETAIIARLFARRNGRKAQPERHRTQTRWPGLRRGPQMCTKVARPTGIEPVSSP